MVLSDKIDEKRCHVQNKFDHESEGKDRCVTYIRPRNKYVVIAHVACYR